jgi:hypothetical protein
LFSFIFVRIFDRYDSTVLKPQRNSAATLPNRPPHSHFPAISALCQEEALIFAEEAFICTAEPFLCKDETFICTDERLPDADPRPRGSDHASICTDERPLCKDQSFICADEFFIFKDIRTHRADGRFCRGAQRWRSGFYGAIFTGPQIAPTACHARRAAIRMLPMKELPRQAQRINLRRMAKKGTKDKLATEPKTAPSGTIPPARAGKPSALLDTRVVYCGENLEQIRKLPDACVDLIYIDPVQ